MRNLNFTTEQVAKEFSKVLKTWLSVEEMAVIVELTKKETDPMICHTGDYCDSNMAMHAAMVNLGVLTEDDESDFDEPFMKLFNDSWDVAKKNFFYVEAPTTTEEIVAYLKAKYDSVSFGTMSKVEASVEDEEAAEILIFIDNEDMNIVNPLFSSCGRFEVKPEQYGINEEDAKLINNHNKVSM